MSWRRDKVVNALPWPLVQEIEQERREDNGTNYRSPGLVSLISDCYREPKNPTELEAHRELVEMGYIVLKRGWPDFLVFNKDDVFAVEVKTDTDIVRPSQRVMLELLAANGIDTYVRRGNAEGSRNNYGKIGKSKRWVERVR